MPRILQPARLCTGVLCLSLSVLVPVLWAQTTTWRKQHDRGNRYEGRIDIPVGKPDLELLSFTAWREPFTTDVTLKVRFCLPSAAPVFIQGRELQEQKQYWMEAKPTTWTAGAWNEFGPWPTRDVLGKEGIPARNVGVVIKLDNDTLENASLLPAFVYHTALPASVTAYLLHLRPNATLKQVTTSLYKIVEDQEVEVRVVSVTGERTAGEPFALTLDVHDLPAGLLRLVIQGAYKHRQGGPLREYRFYHTPQLN